MRITFWMCLILTCVHFSYEEAEKPKSGPFKATAIRAEPCKEASYPMDPDPPVTLLLDIYNTTKKSFLMRGNFTVMRENKQVKLKMKRFIWQNGQWKLLTQMNNVGCHSIMYHLMITALGLKYDRESCGFLKGQYYFENIEPDVLHHIWMSKAEYGRVLQVSEVMRGVRTYTCYETEALIEPL